MTTDLRTYSAGARSTDVFGRVLCDARNHHFVVDGPVQNGCPGEEVNPGELFLSGVSSCAVELLQVFAKQRGVQLRGIGVQVEGVVDLASPGHAEHTLFKQVRVRFDIKGAAYEQASGLVEAFKGR